MFKIWNTNRNEGNRRQYSDAKKVAKRVVAAAMDQTSREAIEKAEISCDNRGLFCIAKQRTKEERFVLGVNCLKNEKGIVKETVDERKSIWKITWKI